MSFRDTLLDALPPPLRITLRTLRQQTLLLARTISKPSIVTHRTIRLRVGEHISPTIRKALYSGQYEGGELTAIRRFVKPGDRVLEVGSGIGFITLVCARIVGDDNVFTYEANPANEPYILENFALTKMQPRLKIGILSPEPGESELFVENNFWSSSTTKRSPGSKSIIVPHLPLDEEMERICPNVIIMDIEGAEYELLEAFDLSGIRKLVIELHPHIIGEERTQQIRDRIEADGFACAWSAEDGNHLCYIRSGRVQVRRQLSGDLLLATPVTQAIAKRSPRRLRHGSTNMESRSIRRAPSRRARWSVPLIDRFRQVAYPRCLRRVFVATLTCPFEYVDHVLR